MGSPTGSVNAKAGNSREALLEYSALIGRTTFNNVGTDRDEIDLANGSIIVKGGKPPAAAIRGRGRNGRAEGGRPIGRSLATVLHGGRRPPVITR